MPDNQTYNRVQIIAPKITCLSTSPVTKRAENGDTQSTIRRGSMSAACLCGYRIILGTDGYIVGSLQKHKLHIGNV